MKRTFPLLVSSAVRVTAPNTKLKDPDRRLELLVKGLQEWRRIKPEMPIVVCDGSGFDIGPAIQMHGLNKNRKIECISFNNEKRDVYERGKGYGEGQIIDMALKRSALINQYDGFFKCTSRHWVENIDSCIRWFNGVAGFDYQGRRAPTLIDTRFYAVETAFYNRHLRDAHTEVDEKAGINLEHAFLRRLSTLRPADYLFRVTPLISGVSGSMGKAYRPSRMRNLSRSLRNGVVCATGIFP